MLLLILMFSLLSCSWTTEYHYPRPQTPFQLQPQPPPIVQEPPKKYIVQTPHGRTYELQAHKSPAIYVAHQTVYVPQQQQQQPLQQQQQQPQQQYQQQFQQQQPQQHFQQQQQQTFQQQQQQQFQQQQQHQHHQHHQQQLLQQHQQQHHQQQYQPQPHHVQQLPTTAFKNPLLVNTNYQQLPVSLTAPPPPAAATSSYYGQQQAQGQYVAQAPQQQLQQQLPTQQQFVGQVQQQVHQLVGQQQQPIQQQFVAQQQQQQAPFVAQTQGQIVAPNQLQLQAPADSYYNAPQALTADTATHVQPAPQYGPPGLQQQQQPQPHDSNPQPYAIVTLTSGQRVQDAGHGSGPLPSAEGIVPPPRIGDYSAQSQSATLDTYNYKQAVPGDSRMYQRYVTKCQPNGQCQQLTLNPGQIDGDHQQLLQVARAQTQPSTKECKKSFIVPAGAEQTDQGELRPRGRRTYVHVKEQLVQYPYN